MAAGAAYVRGTIYDLWEFPRLRARLAKRGRWLECGATGGGSLDGFSLAPTVMLGIRR